MNEDMRKLREEGLTGKFIAEANGLSPEHVSKSLAKKGLGHPIVSKWIETARQKRTNATLEDADVDPKTLLVKDETSSSPSLSTREQLDLFKQIGHNSVLESLEYYESQMFYQHQRAEFVAKRRAEMEDAGLKPTESRLVAEAMLDHTVSLLLRNSLKRKAQAEMARIDYFVAGFELSGGHWPPLPDVKEAIRWI